jgi:hypothetical protein
MRPKVPEREQSKGGRGMSLRDEYTIAVEMQPTTVPKPISIGVLCNGKTCAILTIDQVRAVIAKWDELERAHSKAQFKYKAPR